MLFCIFSLYFIPLFLFAIRCVTASSKRLLAEKIMLSSSYNLKPERFHLKQNNAVFSTLYTCLSLMRVAVHGWCGLLFGGQCAAAGTCPSGNGFSRFCAVGQQCCLPAGSKCCLLSFVTCTVLCQYKTVISSDSFATYMESNRNVSVNLGN